MRSEPLTADDVGEAEIALAMIENAAIAIDDLRERLLRKNDDVRASRARVALAQLEAVRETIEASWR